MSLAALLMPSVPMESRDLRFVARIYVLRMIGLALGSVCVGSVLYQLDAPAYQWVLLAANVALWPHVAARLARNSRDPRGTEIRNLEIDSALGGLWIALMQFNLLPCVVLATMQAIDKIHVGGARLLLRTLTCQLAGCAFGVLLGGGGGFQFAPESTTLNILGALPLLIGYPAVIGGTAHALLRRAHELNRRLEHLNRVDAMTGLLNRMHWQESVGAELRRCARVQQPATLLMIDIDSFKDINDGYGHAIGDEVIRAVAATIHDSTREVDFCGRYGGDEFGVVLVNTTSAQARPIAERIRGRVAAIWLDHAPELTFSVSIGVADIEPGMHQVRDWVERADIALYRAKARGRNRVAALSQAEAVMESLAVARAQCA